ncbi:MAG: hypothetical protein MPN21_17065 [Thermoanaerobaculia bacterium]|nr:hypothetical protein [Thermoanaerobaculia bacterium]
MPLRQRAFSTSRRSLLIILTLLLSLSIPGWASQSQGTADSEAAGIAARSVEAMGGQAAWDAVRYLRFDFFGFRTHHWDRHAGHHRLEGKTRDGDSYVILLDLHSPADARQGDAWLNGEKLSGDDEAQRLDYAWSAWINDVYWLLMPLKLRDPGVHLTSEGTEEIDGTNYQKVKLTFDGVGLTPGDTYWAWFEPKTGLMRRWAYHLENWEADREPTAWDWLDWQTYGDVKMSGVRRNVGDGSERPLADIAIFDELPGSVFTSPDPLP